MNLLSENAFIDFCQRLIQTPGETGSELAVAKLVTAELHHLGFNEIHTDEVGNVIGVRGGTVPGPTLLFDAHMDVVPVTSPEAWQHAPFGGEIADGRLWGRGAADTRGSLAAMLYAAASIPTDELRGRLVMTASVGEETLTGVALRHVLDAYPADVVVTGEPSGLLLGTSQKGRLTLTLNAHGRSAHTSQPELGENAVYKMLEALQRLRALPLPGDPLLGPGILELTEIISEPFPNGSSVPHGCRARFIGRTMPGETRAMLLQRFENALSGIPDLEVGLAELSMTSYTGKHLMMEDFIPGWRNPPDDPWTARILERLARAGLPAKTFAAPCGTNASISAGERGIPSFIYGPGTLAEAHIVDEWVSLTDLHDARHGFSEMLRACLG